MSDNRYLVGSGSGHGFKQVRPRVDMPRTW